MHYLLIPISNLLLDKVIKLDDVIIFPCYFENLSELDFDYDVEAEKETVLSLIKSNPFIIRMCRNSEINLVIFKNDIAFNNIENINNFIESKLYILNRLLDYIRVNYCTFNNKETLIGLPGLINKRKQVFFYDSSFKFIQSINCKPVFYSTQPGIGLDASSIDCTKDDNDIYSALNSNRNDEVYQEFRTILTRACNAMHIIDINRCFCYLFSTVERMASRNYCKFENRKKRVISFISKDQEEFDLLNNQYYFYSKTVRTEIIHKGKNILSIIPLDEATNILNNLFSLIVRFSLNVINSNIHTFDILDNTLDNSILRYNYNKPELPTLNYEFQSFLDTGNFTFIAPINNINSSKILKLGNILLIPKDYRKNFDKLACIYSCFEQGIIDKYTYITTPDDTIIELTQFKDLNAQDIINIQNALINPDIYNMNESSSLAIISNQPFLRDPTWSPVKYFEFCDFLCSNINKSLSYLILSNIDISTNQVLPSMAGIFNNYRELYKFNYQTGTLDNIPGKIYKQYIEPENEFIIPNDFKIIDKVLYDCLYSNRDDEIYLLCNTALTRICECFYINDYTVMLSYMFDILDMLDPEDTEGNKLKSRVLPFLCNSKDEYHKISSKLKNMRDSYRNPLIHHGKNIYDLISTESEIFSLFTDIKEIIISFCKSVFLSNAKTFAELTIESQKKKANLHL